MRSMIKAAKEDHAKRIANKLCRQTLSPVLHKGYVKDLKKLNYTTLVALSPKVK